MPSSFFGRNWWKKPGDWPLLMKQIFGIGLATVVLVWVVCISAVRYLEAEAKSQAYNVSSQIARLAAKSTAFYIDETENLLRYLKRSIEANGDMPAMHLLISSHEAVNYIYRMDENGHIAHNLAINDIYLPHLFIHRENPSSRYVYVGTPVWDVGLSAFGLPVSMPLVKRDGSFDGIVIALLDLSVIAREYDRLEAPPDSKIFLIGRDLRIRAVNSVSDVVAGSVVEDDIFEKYLGDKKSITFTQNEGEENALITSCYSLPNRLLAVRIDTPRENLLSTEAGIARNSLIIALFVSLLILAALSAALRGLHLRYEASATLERNQTELQEMVAERTAELNASNEKLHKLAFFEPETNLPNRIFFMRLLEGELARAAEEKKGGSVIAVNLDNIRVINDAFGRSNCDQVVKNTAERLKGLVPKGAYLAHFGADEFYLVCPYIVDFDELAALLNNLCNSLRHDQQCGELTVSVTATLGGAIYPEDGATVQSIIQSADSAMLFAKKHGKDCWNVFSKEMHASLYDDIALTHEMRSALVKDEFRLAFQPQVDCQTQKVKGYEALIRWQNPTRGFVSPGRFIPLAEQNGLIQPIGKWVFKEACRFIKRLESLGHTDITVSINVSAQQFSRPDFLNSVDGIVRNLAVNPQQIEVEVTETMLMNALDASVERLNALRKRGIKIALDDFGTGYSSLNYLLMLPFDTLKIDKTFIDRIPDDLKGSELVKAIILITRTLNKMTIAEGVETKNQLDYLGKVDCDIIQGYYFSKPLPPDEAVAYLEAHS